MEGSNVVEALFAEVFEAAGVGRQWGETLASREGLTQARWQTMWTAATGQLTVPQIARRLGVSRQNVQRVVNDIEAEGLATYQPNPDHKASPLVILTAAGERALQRINTAVDRDHEQLLEQFPERDVDRLRALLDRFTIAMKNLDRTTSYSPPLVKR
jgi:DNA-binding MarR family transcriptional regulator